MAYSKAITLHSVVPVRATANEQAEQTTQLLFAETCDIEEANERWVRIHIHHDGQEGWCDRKMIRILSDQEWETTSMQQRKAYLAVPIAYAKNEDTGDTIPLTFGTILPDYKDGHFNIINHRYTISPEYVITKAPELNKENIIKICTPLLDTPYLWGGRNSLGMDCSGFVQQVMRVFGYRLPRNASEQALLGGDITTGNCQAGDLCFFGHKNEGSKAKRITHVGIATGSKEIIHCSGQVKRETLTETGIINKAGVLTHDLISIKRLYQQ